MAGRCARSQLPVRQPLPSVDAATLLARAAHPSHHLAIAPLHSSIGGRGPCSSSRAGRAREAAAELARATATAAVGEGAFPAACEGPRIPPPPADLARAALVRRRRSSRGSLGRISLGQAAAGCTVWRLSRSGEQRVWGRSNQVVRRPATSQDWCAPSVIVQATSGEVLAVCAQFFLPTWLVASI